MIGRDAYSCAAAGRCRAVADGRRRGPRDPSLAPL